MSFLNNSATLDVAEYTVKRGIDYNEQVSVDNVYALCKHFPKLCNLLNESVFDNRVIITNTPSAETASVINTNKGLMVTLNWYRVFNDMQHLSDDIAELSLMEVLIHETIHIGQMQSGRLMAGYGMKEWEGELFYETVDPLKYLELPWEVEAFEGSWNRIREMGLMPKGVCNELLWSSIKSRLGKMNGNLLSKQEGRI